MSKLVWDKSGERYYETGVDRGVVYPMVAGDYSTGEAWNGLISTTLSPSGAEATALYANNKKYLNLISLEELSFTIEAYMYPDSFAQCNGEKDIIPGVRVGQQKRTPFGYTFRNLIGNDSEGTAHGYKIHLIYGATAAPSENANTSVNDSPEAKTMSWECKTTAVDIAGFEPTSHIEIDSTTLAPEKLKALEDILYGTEDAEARLPMPDELVEILGEAA